MPGIWLLASGLQIGLKSRTKLLSLLVQWSPQSHTTFYVAQVYLAQRLLLVRMRLGLRHFWRGRAGIQHSHAAVSVDGGKDLLRPWLGKPAGVTTKRRNSFEARAMDFVVKTCAEVCN